MLPPRTITVSNRQVGVDRVTGVREVRLDLRPSYTHGWVMRPDQKTTLEFLQEHDRALVGSDPGLGKTATLIRSAGERARILAGGPASLAGTWREQIAEWAPYLHYTHSTSGPRLPEKGELVFFSYDSMQAIPFTSSSKLLPYSMRDVTLIGDEITACKSGDAQRTQKWRMLASQCGRVWGATGTPMLGTPPDLWGVLVSLNLAHVFGSREEFVKLCGGKPRWLYDKKLRRPVQRGYEWGQVSESVKELLYTVMIRFTRADVLPDLPKQQYINIPVEAPEDLRVYLDEVKDKWDEVGTSELPPFELLSEARAALARSRIPAAIEHVQTLMQSMPILVFSAHRDPVLEVGKLKDAGAFVGETPVRERQRQIDRFREGKIKALAMTIDTGGVGLNLQNAGGVFFIDRDYTPGLNDQAEARAVRPGQKHSSVAIWRMISDHPLDRRLQEILDEKSRLIAAAIG